MGTWPEESLTAGSFSFVGKLIEERRQVYRKKHTKMSVCASLNKELLENSLAGVMQWTWFFRPSYLLLLKPLRLAVRFVSCNAHPMWKVA